MELTIGLLAGQVVRKASTLAAMTASQPEAEWGYPLKYKIAQWVGWVCDSGLLNRLYETGTSSPVIALARRGRSVDENGRR